MITEITERTANLQLIQMKSMDTLWNKLKEQCEQINRDSEEYLRKMREI